MHRRSSIVDAFVQNSKVQCKVNNENEKIKRNAIAHT